MSVNPMYKERFYGNFYFCRNCLRPSSYHAKDDLIKCKNCGITAYIWGGFTSTELSRPIAKVGSEMEGGNDRHPIGVRNHDVTFHGDGSVHFNQGDGCPNGDCDCDDEEDRDCDHCYGECGCGSWQYIGEWVTRPIPYTRNLKRFSKVIMDNYPKGVNDSCGGHIHMSFKNQLIYDLACDENLWIGLKNHLTHWGKTHLNKIGYTKLMNRIHGVNYCRNEFTPELQYTGNTTRYTQLNYCLGKHGTLECRILPMFSNAETYVSAVTEVIHYIEDWVQQRMMLQKPKLELIERDLSGRILPNKVKYYRSGKKYIHFPRKQTLKQLISPKMDLLEI